jgi:hypothetical protein
VSDKNTYRNWKDSGYNISRNHITSIIAVVIVTTIIVFGISNISAQTISQNTNDISKVYIKEKVAPNWTEQLK